MARTKIVQAPPERTIGPFRFFVRPGLGGHTFTYDVQIPSGQTLGTYVRLEFVDRLAYRLLALPIDWATAHTGELTRPGRLSAEQIAAVVAVRDEANYWRW